MIYPVIYLLARLKWQLQDPYYIFRYLRYLILFFTVLTIASKLLIPTLDPGLPVLMFLVFCISGIFLYENPYVRGFCIYICTALLIMLISVSTIIGIKTGSTILLGLNILLVFIVHHVFAKLFFCIATLVSLMFYLGAYQIEIGLFIPILFLGLFVVGYLFVRSIRSDKKTIFWSGEINLPSFNLVPSSPRTNFIPPPKIINQHIHNTYKSKHIHNTVNNFTEVHDESIHVENNSGPVNIGGIQATDDSVVNRPTFDNSDRKMDSKKSLFPKCPECGAFIKRNHDFCGKCGRKLK